MTGLPRRAFAACAHSLKRPATPSHCSSRPRSSVRCPPGSRRAGPRSRGRRPDLRDACNARALGGTEGCTPNSPPREKHMLFRHARARMLAAAALTTTALATVAAAAIAAPASAASTTARGEFPGPAGHAVFVQNDNLTGNQVVAYKRSGKGTLTLAGTYNTGGLGGQLTGSVVDH